MKHFGLHIGSVIGVTTSYTCRHASYYSGTLPRPTSYSTDDVVVGFDIGSLWRTAFCLRGAAWVVTGIAGDDMYRLVRALAVSVFGAAPALVCGHTIGPGETQGLALFLKIRAFYLPTNHG